MRHMWWIPLVVLGSSCSMGDSSDDAADTTADTVDSEEQGCDAICQTEFIVTYYNADFDLDGDFEVNIRGEGLDIFVSCPSGELLRNPPGMKLECIENWESGEDAKVGLEKWQFILSADGWAFPETLRISDAATEGVEVWSWESKPNFKPRKVCDTVCNTGEDTWTHPFGMPTAR